MLGKINQVALILCMYGVKVIHHGRIILLVTIDIDKVYSICDKMKESMLASIQDSLATYFEHKMSTKLGSKYCIL